MFTSGSEVLFCQAYEQSVVTQQLYKVTQHVIGSKHIATIIGLKNWPGRQCNWWLSRYRLLQVLWFGIATQAMWRI